LARRFGVASRPMTPRSDAKTTGHTIARMTAIAYPETLDIDDVDFAFDDLPDLDARLRELRATKPAAWVKAFGGPCMMFTSYELVSSAFRDEETFPSAAFYA